MTGCPECGTLLPPSALACPQCHAELIYYQDEDLGYDITAGRAWAGNTDYDDLARQAGEKMSPDYIDDGNGYG